MSCGEPKQPYEIIREWETFKQSYRYDNLDHRKRVVISGFFNPLHIGHIELMEVAAKYGKLIVIVNNDKQVELKGAIPFQDVQTRCKIVNSIKYVEETYFASDEDETVCQALKFVKPDIFINSGDRTTSNLKELEMCREIGCDVVFIDLPKKQSSSELIKNAAKEYIKRKM